MSIREIRSATVILCGILCVLAVLSCGAAHALEAGAGKAEITPPLGVPMNGYGDRIGRGALKVHDPLWARCLYLNDGKTALFLVTSDLCLINRELRERVLELAPREVPKEHIILTATHTHSGQGGMIQALPFRAVSGRFMPEVLEQTAQRFAEAMRAAYDNRQRAAIGYGTGEQGELSTNRRYDNGPIDPQIGVIRVDDANGNPIAILANFAAHPTTIGGEDKYSISADYPGFFYTTLEQLAPPGCLAMFANGSEGNQRPTSPEGKSGWGRTESIGRLLAERVKGIANTITCTDATLHVGYATPDLPRSMAGKIVPTSSMLQTLEILGAPSPSSAVKSNDLLLTFFPGEVCVEIGLEMRRLALDRGYAAQFTVALSNDYLAYFVPVTYYPYMHYETSSNLYGPRIANWFYEHFTEMMTRGAPGGPTADLPVTPGKPAAADVTVAKIENIGTAKCVVLEGKPYTIGLQRGGAFREQIQRRYQTQIVDAMAAGTLLPREGYWKWAPSWLNVVPLALPMLGIGARPLLQGLSNDTIDELAGMADAAELPFDALWLVQCTPTFGARGGVDAFYRTALCTMFASVGNRAGADDLLVGRNFDWTEQDEMIIVDVRPETGHRFVQIGFSWNAGVFTGMNDAGLVLCAERMTPLGHPGDAGGPVEFVMRELLQTTDNIKTALEALQSKTNLRGYHVLVADPAIPAARVVEFGPATIVREPVKGFLLGADPVSPTVDADARARYARVAELLEKEHIIASSDMSKALADQQPGKEGLARIWNETTRCSVLFQPKKRALRVAFPDASGAPGEYTTISLAGAAP